MLAGPEAGQERGRDALRGREQLCIGPTPAVGTVRAGFHERRPVGNLRRRMAQGVAERPVEERAEESDPPASGRSRDGGDDRMGRASSSLPEAGRAGRVHRQNLPCGAALRLVVVPYASELKTSSRVAAGIRPPAPPSRVRDAEPASTTSPLSSTAWRRASPLWPGGRPRGGGRARDPGTAAPLRLL